MFLALPPVFLALALVFLTLPHVVCAEPFTFGLKHQEPKADQKLLESFQSQEKAIFRTKLPVKVHDVEEKHVWAAQRWVDALTTPAASEAEFMAELWIVGQQISALMRENRIFVYEKGSYPGASFIFENSIDEKLYAQCHEHPEPENCAKVLKEKALKITNLFWASFKEEAEADFRKNNLDEKRVTQQQIKGHILKSFRNQESPVWLAIKDYVNEKKSLNIRLVEKTSTFSEEVAVFSPPFAFENIVHPRQSPTDIQVKKSIHDTQVLLKQEGPQSNQRNPVPAERKDWLYVTSKAKPADLARAASRYSVQSVRSLGCSFYKAASLASGQVLARLLQNGSTDLAQISEQTASSLSTWCYAQFALAKEIIECKKTLMPHLAQLTQYYWQEIKLDLESDSVALTSESIDAYFSKLKSDNAIENSSHPLGKINLALSDALARLEPAWGYRCTAVEDEVFGDYRYVAASDEAKEMAKVLLDHLKGNEHMSPPGYCAQRMRIAYQGVGVLKSSPGWNSAYMYAKGFEKENTNHNYLAEGFEMKKMDFNDPLLAPDYADIVYGGPGHGHIEKKIPVADLLSRGIKTVIGAHGKEIDLTTLTHVYVSDYIDAYPRNHPKSRLAREGTLDNNRPVRGIYVIMRKS